MPPIESVPRCRELLRDARARDDALDQAPVAPRARLRPQDLGRRRLCPRGTRGRAGRRVPCADLELTPEVRDDHASYIATWLNVLKNDNRAIFQAAAHAQRAVDYLHKLQPEPMEAAA